MKLSWHHIDTGRYAYVDEDNGEIHATVTHEPSLADLRALGMPRLPGLYVARIEEVNRRGHIADFISEESAKAAVEKFYERFYP